MKYWKLSHVVSALVLTLLINPLSAATLTQVSITSDPDDFIGQGQSYFLDDSARWTVEANDWSPENDGLADFIRFYVSGGTGSDYMSLDFSTHQLNHEMRVGDYTRVTRAAIAPAGWAGLDVSINSRGAGSLLGNFTVLEAVFDYSQATPTLVSFAAEFEQHIGGNPPGLYGSIYYNYELKPVPVPAAVWLFSAGLLGLLGVARRKTSS